MCSLTLGEEGSLAGLVLGDLVDGVLAALAAWAEGLAGLGDVDHLKGPKRMRGIHLSNTTRFNDCEESSECSTQKRVRSAEVAWLAARTSIESSHVFRPCAPSRQARVSFRE